MVASASPITPLSDSGENEEVVETSSIERASVDSKSVENEIAVTKTKPPVSQQQCGAGLIVNAKLARFIQEQASQVSALVMLSKYYPLKYTVYFIQQSICFWQLVAMIRYFFK